MRRVISLRQDGGAQKVVGEMFPAYSAETERTACDEADLAFTSVSSVDLTGLHPQTVLEVLNQIDTAIANGEPTFVHCTAGVGRTGVVTAAWMMTRGWSSTEAAETFLRFCDSLYAATGLLSGGEEAYFEGIGVHEHWWSILHIAGALGLPSPVAHRQYVHPLAPEGARTKGWSKLYQKLLARWGKNS